MGRILVLLVPLLLLAESTRAQDRKCRSCHAQRNNNAYRRDNEIIWFDWELRRTYPDIHRFVRMMVAFRARRDVVIERSRLTLNELLKQARIE